jgi:predicted ABC-type transport system involved in lysophospholipase L1 biosynthesis ATPase subunit
LFRLAREYETAVVIVTHNRQLAGQADRILWLEDGRLTVVRSVDAIP